MLLAINQCDMLINYARCLVVVDINKKITEKSGISNRLSITIAYMLYINVLWTYIRKQFLLIIK